MRLPIALAACVGGFATALVAGCGINTEDAGRPNPNAPSTTATGTRTTTVPKDLPKRPKGVVQVEGAASGSLTPRAIPGVSGVRVNYVPQGESDGFRDLCAGEIDVLETSRQITDAERRACERNGLGLAEAIQVASDAVVIATPNEHDVGGDCLRISTVNEIFRAGSPIDNWQQVGFFDIPLRATGGPADTAAFQFFAQLVLGVEAGATVADMRSDYIVHRREDDVRREVTNETRIARVRARYRERISDLEFERELALRREVNDAIERARDRMLAQFERENEERARNEVTLTDAEKAFIERQNLRRIRRAIAEAQARAERRFSFPRLTILRNRYRRDLREARHLGTIGIFRFSYYELFENSLRPMEIWDPERAAAALARMRGVRVVRDGDESPTTTSTSTTTTSTATTTTSTITTPTSTTPTTTTDQDGEVIVNADQTPWCVFPSQQTITNQSYPLSRPFLLYVSVVNLERDEVQAFLKSYIDRSQQLARQNRLVPVPDSVIADNRLIVELDETPGVSTDRDVEQARERPRTTTGPLPGVGERTTTSTTPTVPTTTSTTATTSTTTATTP